MESEPNRKCVGMFGDVNPIEHSGGYIFLRDDLTAYAEYIEPPSDDAIRPLEWTVYTVILDKCTYINGVLSDNPFHPDYPAWFADDIGSVAGRIGADADDLRERLCSDDPKTIASAYVDLTDYFGWDEFDQYPFVLSGREIRARYKNVKAS